MNIIRTLKWICLTLFIRYDTVVGAENSTDKITVHVGDEAGATFHGLTTSMVNPPPDYFEERCLRRFSPGTCAEPVYPVFTYAYRQHNCTQRLGCVVSSRTNRFKTYSNCARVCQAYMDLWTVQNMAGVRSKTDNNRGRSQIIRKAKQRSEKEKAYMDLIEFENSKKQHELSLMKSLYEPSDIHDAVYGGVRPQEFESYL